MDDTTDRVSDELSSILEVLTALTGLPSNWSGKVEVVPEATFLASKPFGCDNVINRAIVNQQTRWRTYIHECLHAISTGYIRTDYEAFPGWEEGVVERLQRLYRPTVLAKLRIEVAEAIFEPFEARHLFNRYIAALESLRQALKKPEPDFYRSLLATPIKEHPGFVLSLGNVYRSAQRKEFITLFSMANATLRTA